MPPFDAQLRLDVTKAEPGDPGQAAGYKVDEFVNEAVKLRITPFMLDNYSHEYEDILVSLT
jgi:hypothetical protein